jgi:hypothetical protein
MKFLLYILLILVNFSCSGQEKSAIQDYKKSEDSVIQLYQKQKHHFEFDTYKMFYNQKLIKLETVANTVNIFGKPDYGIKDITYNKNPINILAYAKNKIDKYGNYLVSVNGREFPINDSKGHRIEENWRLYIDNNGEDVYVRDNNGILIGEVYTYRLWMSPYEITSYIPTKQDSINAKIPALNGYIKINGKLIHQSITKKELKEKLYPLPKGGQLTNMLGDPVLIYDLGKDYKKFDPNMDPEDTRVFIDIVFKTDPKTKEEKGIYYINYYYNLKQKD